MQREKEAAELAGKLRKKDPLLFNALLLEMIAMINGSTEREAVGQANSFLAECGHESLPDIA